MQLRYRTESETGYENRLQKSILQKILMNLGTKSFEIRDREPVEIQDLIRFKSKIQAFSSNLGYKIYKNQSRKWALPNLNASKLSLI